MFHGNPQHLNLHTWCLGVDSSKNKASLWRWQRELLPLRDHQQGPSTSQSGPLFDKWCRENLVDFSTPSVKQVSDVFMYLYQDLNRQDLPLMVIGWPLLTLWAQRGSISLKVQLLSSFHRDRPKSSRNLPKWDLSVVLNSVLKIPFLVGPGRY